MVRHPADAAAQQRCLREAALLRRLSRDRRIVQFYGACLAPAPAGARFCAWPPTEFCACLPTEACACPPTERKPATCSAAHAFVQATTCMLHTLQ